MKIPRLWTGLLAVILLSTQALAREQIKIYDRQWRQGLRPGLATEIPDSAAGPQRKEEAGEVCNREINIRFLAQGMVKLQPSDLPENFSNMSKEELLQWSQEYLWKLSREQLLEAVAYLDIEEDTYPGAVELFDGEDYGFLVQTRSWQAFHSYPAAQEIIQA